MRSQTIVCRVTLILALSLLPAIPAVTPAARAAGPWYVAQGGSDANSCLSTVAPCATVNGAIGKASDGDTIYVAADTYTGVGGWVQGENVVVIDRSITLSGGWNGAFTARTGSATIDGQASRRGILVNEDRKAVVEGFHIQNGTAGIQVYSRGILTLSDSLVEGNTGGGIGGPTIIVSRCTIRGNGGSGVGGNTIIVNDSIVEGNTAQDGGGINSGCGAATLNNSAVVGNSASGDWGGIYVHGTRFLNSSTIGENQAYNIGGVGAPSGPATLQNAIVASNLASVVWRLPPDCGGDIHAAGFNLISNTFGCDFARAAGDLLNVQPGMVTWAATMPWLPPAGPSTPAIQLAAQTTWVTHSRRTNGAWPVQ